MVWFRERKLRHGKAKLLIYDQSINSQLDQEKSAGWTILFWQTTLPFFLKTTDNLLESFRNAEGPKSITNNTECERRPSEWACLPCYCQSEIVYRNKQLSYFVLNTDFFFFPTTDTERTFSFNWKKKIPFQSKFPSFKKISGAEMPFTCFIYMRNRAERDLKLSTI